MVIARTDGGDGPQHTHRPFVMMRSHDGGTTWSSPREVGPAVGSARPNLVVLASGRLLLSGGRPGVNLWSSIDDGATWTAFNVPSLHNARLTSAGLNPAVDSFCAAMVAQSDGNSLNGTWCQSSGYTGLSLVNATSALLCYDTADGSTGGYSQQPPPQCRKTEAAVYCMVVAEAEHPEQH